ncbi:prepilin peptidase [Bacillus haynesii]|uniref:prepilin peptidase n=2 Tax=Bacillus haynesii TaxID=1925021 RepID=UPI002281EC55|nr:A24 family peptidase [Bacillus haynesii]MCY7915590.1 A24 family peptidase [Bacillus haynesii]MCY8080015.1 A24 family peptidase [Bacillus haynesii]MCY8383345.1 A24 family peptidase [Bacillus haynesii]MCY8589817.1 A24 family peptidase [Bacillus haynesii]MCY9372791.1 A24 family peptidase [Bacillus haynesii]
MMFIFYLFTAGLVLGSFFNSAGHRIPEKISLIAPRSLCRVCKRQLGFAELIPVLSYLMQRGRCKGCQTPVSIVYPAVELSAAILFAFAGMRIGHQGELVIVLALISMLLVVFVSDVAHMVIPDAVLCFFLLVFAIGRFLVPLEQWHSGLSGALVGGMLPLLTLLLTKGGIGWGDVKLFAVIGMALGSRLLVLAFFLSAAAGTMLGLIALLAGKLKKNEPMPFAPAILIGTLTSCFYGDPMIEWYLQTVWW